MLTIPVLASLLASTPAPASMSLEGGWTTGSTGALGDVVYGPGTHVIDLAREGVYDPVNWRVVFDYQSLTIQSGATVTFANHPSRAPVVMRALGEVVIDGVVRLNGAAGLENIPALWSEPAPGAFRGGRGHRYPFWEGSAGHGPGGGFDASPANGGSASHATVGQTGFNQAPPGPTYGSLSALPLIGGSGGSGGNLYNDIPSSSGGGSGGGAILVGSDTRIRLGGRIEVNGGSVSTGLVAGGGGSGGTIRLAAPEIVQTNGLLQARGGTGGTSLNRRAGDGRIRLEMEGDPGTPWLADPVPSLLFSLSEFLPDLPTVSLQSWWDTDLGRWVPIAQDPSAIILPPSQADVQMEGEGACTVRLEGRGVPLGAPLHIRVTQTHGSASVDSTHTMGEVAGSTLGTSWTDVVIDFTQGVTAVQVRAELP